MELALELQFAFNQTNVLTMAKEPDFFWKLRNTPAVLQGPPRTLDVGAEYPFRPPVIVMSHVLTLWGN